MKKFHENREKCEYYCIFIFTTHVCTRKSVILYWIPDRKTKNCTMLSESLLLLKAALIESSKILSNTEKLRGKINPCIQITKPNTYHEMGTRLLTWYFKKLLSRHRLHTFLYITLMKTTEE